MSTTYSIDRIGGTPADVSVPILDKSTLKPVSLDTPSVSANEISSTYTIESGDQSLPTYVKVATALDISKLGKSGLIRSYWDLSSYARASDGVNPDDVAPISARTTILVPGGLVVEAADISTLLLNLFSLSFTSLSSKVPSTDLVTALMFRRTRHY